MTGNIVILTGAGISAESGIGTFRDKGGLWSQVRLEDVATPEGFARDPERVLEFYNFRREKVAEAEPNEAHKALARLEAAHPGETNIITQNVDWLHEKAGSRNVIHMHGRHNSALCAACGDRWPWRGPMSREDICPGCDSPGGVRPDVVWFGETPYEMERIIMLLHAADLFVSIGTSGSVYPANGFVAEARAMRTPTLELNLEPSDGARFFDEARHGPATRIVPAWVDEVLNGLG